MSEYFVLTHHDSEYKNNKTPSQYYSIYIIHSLNGTMLKR